MRFPLVSFYLTSKTHRSICVHTTSFISFSDEDDTYASSFGSTFESVSHRCGFTKNAERLRLGRRPKHIEMCAVSNENADRTLMYGAFS